MLNWENLSYSINLDQLWKLDSTEKLISKGKVWQSDDKWKLLCKLDSTMCYIENHSIYMVLETTFHEKVIEEDLIEEKPEQLWQRRFDWDNDVGSFSDYFTLRNFETSNLMTAISEDGLETKGKYNKMDIVLTCIFVL